MTEQERIRNRILKSGKFPTSPTAASPAAAGDFTPTAMFENVPKLPATSYASALANATVPKTTPKYNTSYAQTFAEMRSPKISTTPPTSYKDVKIPQSDMTYGELEEFRIKADKTVKKIAEENAKAKVENDSFWRNYSTVPKPVGEGDSADMIFTPKDSSAKDVAMVSLSGTKNNGALYMPEGWEDAKEISPQRMIAVVPKIGNKVTEQFYSVKQPIETELNELYADLDELDARIYPHRHTLSISTTEEDKAAVRKVLAPLEAEKTELEKKIAEKEARFQEVKSLERLLIYNEYQNVLKNDPESKRKIIDGQRIDGDNTLLKGHDAYLTPDERQIYYYIVAEYGKVEARKFLSYFEDELRFRKAQFEYEYIDDDPDGWLKKAALVYGGSFVDAVTGAWGGIKQFFSDKPVEKPYIVDTANYIKAQETGAAGVAYDVLGTLGYMTPAMLTATLAGTGVAGNLFTYLSASGNAYSEKIKQGYSPAEAKIYSNLVGAAEAGLQYALGGISKLGKGADTGLIAQKIGSIENAFVRASTDLAYRGLKEITEEELQLFLEPFISSMVFDEKYDAPTMEEMLYTALISFGTTGIFEIPEIAVEYSAVRNNNKADKKLDSRLRSDNSDVDGETTSHTYAENNTASDIERAEEEALDFEDDTDAMYSEPLEKLDGRSFEELMGLDGTEKSTSTSKVPEIKLPTAEDILSGNYTPATPVTPPVKGIKPMTDEEARASVWGEETPPSEDIDFENVDFENEADTPAFKAATPIDATSSDKVPTGENFKRISGKGKKQIADTSYDSSGMINTQPINEDKGLWEKIKDGANYLDSKLIDSGRGVTKIAEETGDGKLYGYYNMARASQNIAAYMVMNAATDINGRATGKSLTAIFEPIHQKGKDYYRKFQEYLYHKHNIDRMSLKSNNEDIATVNNAFVDFQKSHPELNAYTPSQISEIAHTPGHELHDEAKEYMKLARLSDEVRRRENKPVFGPDASGKVPNAKESRIISDNLLAEHPEFAEYAKEVYSYLDNLMDYREASGLITPEQRAVLKKLYPNYVPTFRVTKKGEGRRNKNKVEIGSTIGKAEGGTTTLMPIEQALIQLTGQVVSEGTKNRFGSRLLNDVMKYSGKDYEKSPVAKYVVEEPAKADYFNGAEYYDDTVQRGKNDKATTNTFVVYKDGKRWQMKTNGLLYEAVSALDRNATEELNLMAKTNDVFKKLITEYNPAFLIRNGIKDIQEALFNSKDLSKFMSSYPSAIKQISENGEYWQVYQALGGLNASLYDSPGLSPENTSKVKSDYEKGIYGDESLGEKAIEAYKNANKIIEQLPRFAEFVATVKKNGGIENASMDVLTEAMYNAAEVTTNFGRSGQWTKALNKYAVPFLNPAVQGASKAIRNITSARSFAAWARLIAKGVIFGFTPELLNYLFYSDDEDYESISDENKANYYLFKYDDGKFIKIPKGRYISAINYTFREMIDAIKGEKFDVVDTVKHVTDQIGVANPLTNNFIMPFIKVALTDDENPGETWYGSDIEGQNLQNLPVAERYDARTDELSKFIGKTFNLSPKKINYLLNQYGGVLADVFLPMLTPAAENDLFEANFTLDSTASNKYSGEYYDAKKKADYSANSINATPYDTLSQKYWANRTKGVSEVNKAIRQIEADESLSDNDKKELLHVQYGIRNGLYKTALDSSEEFDKVSRKYYDKAPYKADEDKLSYAFAMATRDIFGAEYALSSTNKTALEEATELADSGITYDEYFDAYFVYDNIKAKNQNSKIRRTEFARWLNNNSEDMTESERAALREALIGEGETSYDKLVGAGVSDKGAYEVGLKLDKLDPDPYSTYKTVQPYQKYQVIVNSDLTKKDITAAMKAISTDAQAKKIQRLADAGIDLELFADLAQNIGKADKSVWSVSNSELQVWINRLTPPALGLDAPLTWPKIKSTMYSILTENKNNSSVPSSTHIKMVLDKHYGRTK